MTTIRAITSRDFTRDVAAAKRAAAEGPVFITDRGKPAYALLKIENYYEITGKAGRSLMAAMDALPSTEGIAYEAPRMTFTPQDVDA